MRWFLLLFCLVSLAFAQPPSPQRVRPGPALQVDFSRIDAHALAAPPGVEQDVDRLAHYLVRPATHDVERIRAIHRWVSDRIAYDTNSFFNNQIISGDPALTLRRRIAVCDGYSRLIAALGKAAGLDVEVIQGDAKGYGKRVGHAWNAVRLNRGWYLLDSCWSAGAVGSDQVFVKSYNDFYFFTDPAQMATSHFPADPRWQLLSKALDKETFQTLPRQRKDFFRLGLKLRSHKENLITMKASRLSVELEGPAGVQLLARLWQNGAEIPRNYTLVRRTGGSLWVDVAAPGPGSYLLHVFAKRSSEAQFQSSLEYDLEVDPRAQLAPPYPVTTGDFQDCQARIIAPQVGELRPGMQNFELEVPGAEAVFLASTDKQLQRQDRRFQGQFEVQPGTVSLFANFPGQPSKCILTYIVR